MVDLKEKKDDNLEFTLYDTLNISDYLKVKGKEPVKTPKTKPVSNQQEVKSELCEDLKTELNRIKKSPSKSEITETKSEEKQKKLKIDEPEVKATISKEVSSERKKISNEDLLRNHDQETIQLVSNLKKQMQEKKMAYDSIEKVESPKVEKNLEPIISSEIHTEEQKKEKNEKSNVVLENNAEEIFDSLDSEFLEEGHEKESDKQEQAEIGKTKSKSKKGLKVALVSFIILDVLACIGLFLTYGPISYFRNLLVTSAMTTMNHKYLARTFYSEKTIEKILKQNHIKETGENTDTGAIDFEDGKDTGEYESIYEEQILKREEGNDLYKVIEIKESGYKGYLVAIYDASRVHLVGANNLGYGGALLTDISKKNKAIVAMNASGFFDGSASGKGSVAVGTVIQNGKVITTSAKSGMGGGIAGFNKDHILVLTKQSAEAAIADGMVDAVEFGPFLIVNGKSSEVAGNGGWGLAPRTVLAQRKDGIVLFLVIDGRGSGGSIGAGMDDLIEILERYKAYNAVNLDGGGSSTLTVEQKLKNNPSGGERYIPNAWIVK